MKLPRIYLVMTFYTVRDFCRLRGWPDAYAPVITIKVGEAVAQELRNNVVGGDEVYFDRLVIDKMLEATSRFLEKTERQTLSGEDFNFLIDRFWEIDLEIIKEQLPLFLLEIIFRSGDLKRLLTREEFLLCRSLTVGLDSDEERRELRRLRSNREFPAQKRRLLAKIIDLLENLGFFS